VCFSVQLHVHANGIGISSRLEQTQNGIASHSAGHENSLCMYMRMSFDVELVEFRCHLR
jgi:hypothetical protein